MLAIGVARKISKGPCSRPMSTRKQDEHDKELQQDVLLNRDLFLNLLAQTVERNLEVNKQLLALQEKIIVLDLATIALSVNVIISLVSQHILQGHHHYIFIALTLISWAALLLSAGNGWNAMSRNVKSSKTYIDDAERESMKQILRGLKSQLEKIRQYKQADTSEDLAAVQAQLDTIDAATIEAEKSAEKNSTLNPSVNSLSLPFAGTMPVGILGL